MDANGLWDVVDTSLVPRDEIEMLTRSVIDYLRNFGFRKIADKFVAEAKIEQVEEVEGISYKDYLMRGLKSGGRPGMSPWIFFCYERLMLKRLQEDTPEGTQTQNMSGDEDDGMILSDAKKEALQKVFEYISGYFGKNMHLMDALQVNKEETDKAQTQGGSGEGKPSGEAVVVE